MNTADPDISDIEWHVEDDEASARVQGPPLPLISPERMKKLDLLRHLLTHSREAILVCGPDGIGKTTLLKLVAEQAAEARPVCYLNASPGLTFETVLSTVQAVIPSDTRSVRSSQLERTVADRLDALAAERTSFWLLLDDADELLVGLADRLCRFSESHPTLRLVLAMRPDSLHVKSATDPAIDDCCLIDIPALQENQCGDFLHQLTQARSALLAPKRVTSAFIAEIYRRTHGIPGRILAALPHAARSRKYTFLHRRGGPLLHALGVSLLAFIVLAPVLLLILRESGLDFNSIGLSWMAETETAESGDPAKGAESTDLAGLAFDAANRSVALAPGVQPDFESGGAPINPVDVALPALAIAPPALDNASAGSGAPAAAQPGGISGAGTGGIGEAPGVESFLAVINAGAARPGPAAPARVDTASDMSELQARQPNPMSQPGPSDGTALEATAQAGGTDATRPADSAANEIGVSGVNGSAWLMVQNPQYYTLQLLAVRNEEAVVKFIRTHPGFRQLAAVRPEGGGKGWFRLLEGVYPSLAEARRAAQALPRYSETPWPRKMESVQREIRGRTGR